MKNISKSIIPGFVLFFISCHSSEEKTDSAYEDAKESKEFTDDSLDMETEAELVPLLKTKPMKMVVVDPWTKYSREIEKEIEANEKTIADLRIVAGSDAKEFKKTASLENDNRELQSKLIEYKQKYEADMEKFKSEMRMDLVELEQQLKELSEGIQAN